jgi:hypothetical protein
MTDRNLVVIMNDVGLEVCRFSQPMMVVSRSLRDILMVLSMRRQIIKERTRTNPRASIRVGLLRKRLLTIRSSLRKPKFLSTMSWALYASRRPLEPIASFPSHGTFVKRTKHPASFSAFFMSSSLRSISNLIR